MQLDFGILRINPQQMNKKSYEKNDALVWPDFVLLIHMNKERYVKTARLAMRNRRTYRRDQQCDNVRRARRNASNVDLNRAAFKYACTIDYSTHPFVRIGPMEIMCDHCGALKFAGETPGLCCLSGKVKLPLLPSLPEPLHSLLRGETPESRHFLSNTQR